MKKKKKKDILNIQFVVVVKLILKQWNAMRFQQRIRNIKGGNYTNFLNNLHSVKKSVSYHH